MTDEFGEPGSLRWSAYEIISLKMRERDGKFHQLDESSRLSSGILPFWDTQVLATGVFCSWEVSLFHWFWKRSGMNKMT